MPWEKQFNSEEVLDLAMQAFWSRGYEATSMQDLVNCTGVNRASLYATYGDKRALFIAALKKYNERNRKAMLTDLEDRYPPLEAVRQVFKAFIDQASTRDGRRGCFLTNTALELASHDLEIGNIVSRAQEDVELFFARAIKKAKGTGEIDSRIKTTEAARGLLASLLGLLVLIRSRPDPALLNSVADDALNRLG